jgi:hypothetical protein
MSMEGRRGRVWEDRKEMLLNLRPVCEREEEEDNDWVIDSEMGCIGVLPENMKQTTPRGFLEALEGKLREIRQALWRCHARTMANHWR